MLEQEEVWKPIPSEPGYDASSLGRIRSWRKPGVAKGPRRVPLIRKLTRDPSGYLRVILRGRSPAKMVHKLVAETFLGPIPEGLQVDHINRCKVDNRASNLRYVTVSENLRNRRMHGRYNPKSKLTDYQRTVVIRCVESGAYCKKFLAQQFGIAPLTINGIMRRYRARQGDQC